MKRIAKVEFSILFNSRVILGSYNGSGTQDSEVTVYVISCQNLLPLDHALKISLFCKVLSQCYTVTRTLVA